MDDFPRPLKYIDVNRQTKTSIDVLHEATIDDYWNFDGDNSLSEPWIGVTRFVPLNQNIPEGGVWVPGRRTKQEVTTWPEHLWPIKSSQRRAINGWTEEKPKLDAAREQKGICSIPDNDPDYEEIMNNAQRKLGIGELQRCCKVTPANPNGPCWERPWEWRPVSARSSNIHHDGDWSIKLQATGIRWSIKLRATCCHCRCVKHQWRESLPGCLVVLQRISRHREEEHEFIGICARFVKDPHNLKDSPLNVAIRSQFTSDWARIMKTSNGWRWIEVSQEQKIWYSLCNDKWQTLIERRDSYNVPGLAGVEHSSLVKKYVAEWSAANLIRMRVHAFSESTLWLESRIQMHPLFGNQIGGHIDRTNTDWSKHWIWQPEQCNSFGTYNTRDIKKHIQRYLHWLSTGVIFMSMFNDIEWTKKGNTEPVCAMPKKWQHLRPSLSRILVLPEDRVRIFVVERKFQWTS